MDVAVGLLGFVAKGSYHPWPGFRHPCRNDGPPTLVYNDEGRSRYDGCVNNIGLQTRPTFSRRIRRLNVPGKALRFAFGLRYPLRGVILCVSGLL